MEINNEIMSIMKQDTEETVYALSLVDRESKVAMYNAITNPTKLMSENVGDVLEVKNFAITPVTLEDDKTHEILTLPRTVILCQDNTSYSATSVGIYNSIKTICSLFEDEFADGELKVKIKQKTTRNGNKTLILEVV